MKPEAQLQSDIVLLLKAIGITHFAVSNEATYKRRNLFKSMGMRPGVADLVLVLPGGKVEFWELKTPEGKQSQVQKEFEEEVHLLGHNYFIIRTMEDAEERINALGKCQ